MFDVFFEKLGPGTKVFTWFVTLGMLLVFLLLGTEKVSGCWVEDSKYTATNDVALQKLRDTKRCLEDCQDLGTTMCPNTAVINLCYSACKSAYSEPQPISKSEIIVTTSSVTGDQLHE